MARWGAQWGAKWSRTTPARWGDAWGVPWTTTDHQEDSETPEQSQDAQGGVYSGFVQPNPGKRRKKNVNPDEEINRLVGEVMEGDKPKPDPPAEPSPLPVVAEHKPKEITARAAMPLIPLDSDDDEAIVLLLVA